MSCPYKYALGIPGKGIHQYRFLDTAILDYIGSILIAMIITKLTKIPLVLTTIGVFVLGIILHMIFCLKTGTEVWLFH
jgi:uncharacterized membrane protein YcaP (DUF421 family)